MSTAALRILLASVLLSTLVVTASSKVDHIEESSLVQGRVVMGSGVRRVQPLEQDEDLEDDMSDFDDDTPSLMQAEVCRKQAKSKLRPLNAEEIDDEVSMLQTEVVVNRDQPQEGDDYGIEEEEDQFSAMQTSVTVTSAERLVGTGRSDGEEDDFDGASFMQNEATFIKKSERTDTGCTNGELQGILEDDDEHHATDVFSLMQTDAVLNQPQSEEVDDKLSLVQTEEKVSLRGMDRSKILAWDTILAMDVNTEKDEVQQMAAMLRKESSTAKALTEELTQLNDVLDAQDLSAPEEDFAATNHAK